MIIAGVEDNPALFLLLAKRLSTWLVLLCNAHAFPLLYWVRL